jgi:hypothetical protein
MTTVPVWQRTDTPVVEAQHEKRLRLLEKPRNPRWMYVTPVAPATTPTDYLSGYAGYAAFESPWGNIGTAPDPTAFRMREGKPELRLAVTGGEDLTNSLIFTLPAGFRPTGLNVLLVPVGDPPTAVGVVTVTAAGAVTWIGYVVGGTAIGGGGGAGVDGGSP